MTHSDWGQVLVMFGGSWKNAVVREGSGRPHAARYKFKTYTPCCEHSFQQTMRSLLPNGTPTMEALGNQ